MIFPVARKLISSFIWLFWFQKAQWSIGEVKFRLISRFVLLKRRFAGVKVKEKVKRIHQVLWIKIYSSDSEPVEVAIKSFPFPFNVFALRILNQPTPSLSSSPSSSAHYIISHSSKCWSKWYKKCTLRSKSHWTLSYRTFTTNSLDVESTYLARNWRRH